MKQRSSTSSTRVVSRSKAFVPPDTAEYGDCSPPAHTTPRSRLAKDILSDIQDGTRLKVHRRPDNGVLEFMLRAEEEKAQIPDREEAKLRKRLRLRWTDSTGLHRGQRRALILHRASID